ncbi:relaxase domain-containing protein [Nocardia cyriacigeorgica]|uniref:MobF family relaxase n=1 Tax=Nocardia cyriacigeorgica TaxID=135487 RepID=UPI0018957EBD|nr:MobF family relaxase [Nocardia cyriacigeorgica]MBF6102252.1 relaxase domain-containing protein [Nocardia cyriacigeorgica]
MTATIHKVVAGNGYQYYLRNIAAHDTESRGRSSLSDYYSAHGESPGVWQGTGLASLGIDVGAEVTESQIKSLFGLGRHPDAEVIEDRVYQHEMAAGCTPKQADDAADKASRIGNPYRVYAVDSDFRKKCLTAFTEHNIAHGKAKEDALSDEDRERIRTHVAFEMFTEEYSRPPQDARELSGWIAKNSRPPSTAVAGFDITFSPVKSVSALWALAPLSVSAKIEAAHRAAVADALAWLEQHGIYTRLGRNGVRQVDVEGIVAACFTHRDSRAGDPDLHTHVLIANRVRTLDGRWRTLDGAAVYRVVVTVSEIYNTRLEHHLEEDIGVEFAERPGTDPTKRPIREIIGVPIRLIEAWSRRETAIRSRVGALAADFQHRHGREPTPIEMRNLAQQATLETRPAKHQSRSLAEQRHGWHGEAIALLGSRTAVAGVVSAALNPLRLPRVRVTAEWIARTADQVLEVVAEHRSTWRPANVRAEIERQIRGRVRGCDWEHVAEAVLTAALDPARSIALGDPDVATEPELATVPDALRRRDHTSVYTPGDARIFTSTRILTAEDALIQLSVQPGARRLEPEVVAAAIREHDLTHRDRPLNAGQRSVIEEFATSGLRVRTANAPAGTGKTTAMWVLTRAWETSGGAVLGLAPTAAAAAVLGESIGARCETVDKLLTVVDLHTPTSNTPEVEADHPPPLPQWVLDIDAGTLVIVDEHVKIGTLKRLKLLRFLTARGATIRCLGDDHQLPAIDAGGVEADMTAAAPERTLTLTHVVRFASTAEASASLLLRDGDPAALGWYLDNNRVHGGHTGATHDDAYTAWAADHAAGREAIMLAANHGTVTALNTRARADRITREGRFDGWEVALADDTAASVGDTIRTRRNNQKLRLGARDWVRNGYAWTVTAVHADGSITARHHGKSAESVRLPADYVAQYVRLGYAATIDSAQGITADTCHVVLTGGETRQQLYVAMTRGVHANHAYIPSALSGEEGSFYTEPAVFPRTAVENLIGILARDGAQKSATTQLRDALDPHRRIGRALDIYHDSIAFAAENALGPTALARLDATAETLHPGLTDSPAYPTLRGHLATLAVTGTDPLAVLRATIAERELDTAADPAAVLDWRIDPTGVHSTGTGPLPWTPAIPPGLDTTSTQTDARARILTELATQIHRDTTTWSPLTAPAWARPLFGTDSDLLADLAVWRASLHIPDTDLQPTGPRRYPIRERNHQQMLDARIDTMLGDPMRPVHRWADTVRDIEPRILDDPHWPTIAERIDLAAHAGIDITTRLNTAADLKPLPDEMPAAALWSRLELDSSALDSHDRNLRPDWITDLPDILGTDTADRVTTDPAWPRIVAAVDRAAGTGWTPRQLLATAHELLAAATPDDDATGLRPDQIAAALAWRIDALLHHTPTTATTQSRPMTEHKATPMTEPAAHEHPPDPESPPSDHDVPARSPSAPSDAQTSGAVAEVDVVAELFRQGRIRTAVHRFRAFQDRLTEEQRWVLGAVADTLYHHPFPIATAHLRRAGQRFPDHQALIDACTPASDPGVHQNLPDPRQASPSYDRERRDRAPREHETRHEPDLIHDPLPDPQVRARRQEQDYHDTRAGIDEQPWARPDAHEVRRLTDDPDLPHSHLPPLPRPATEPHRESDPLAARGYRRDEAKDPTPAAYALDYDKAASPRARGLECVSCSIERHPTDATPIPPRRSDDGLCHDCRDTNQPGIPDYDPAQHPIARANHLAATRPLSTVHAILRRDWKATSSPDRRAQIEAWVHEHPLTGTRPTSIPPTDDPLFTLTDTELADRISELRQQLALIDTHTTAYAPAPPEPDDRPNTDQLVTRHRAACDAIQAAHHADEHLHRATRALLATRTELATHRQRLAETSPRQRRTRHVLNTRINELIGRQAAYERELTRARTEAREARRNATNHAGTPDHWDDVLTDSPERSQPIPPRHHAEGTGAMVEQFVTDVRIEIEQLRAEQCRRHELTAAQHQHEHALRHTSRAEMPHEQTPPGHTTPTHDPDVDRDL